ncbi:MAG: Excinuclease ABC subunit C [Candidatus Gottesmanbacteria bacterium GW2011_GWC2_42_8]|nr:MAG: Excinuclease ABC subunit C [Candidatus Gottesmanbacteria bacterium GW2011_GWC2_42_8]
MKITSEEYPRLLLSRKRSDLDGELFGPFPSRQTVKTIIKYLRRVFPFCSQNPKIKKACFYSHLDLCFPCPAQIKKMPDEIKLKMRRIYLKNITNLRRILSGKIESVVKNLTHKMQQKSAQKLFEDAALIRDKIRQLKSISGEKFTPSQYLAEPQLISNLRKEEQRLLESELGTVFKSTIKAETIECYDISNLSGKNAAGSLVTFYRGLPDKKRYRHFRIKTVKSPDDFAMLKEILSRRLKHPEWRLPDLLVVDGGEQQLRIFSGVLTDLKINVPVIALAKKEERIYYARDEKTAVLDLTRDSPALQLIQRLRDEAHRFAGRYHRLLRIKYLFNA